MAAIATPRLDVCQTAQQTAEGNAFDCTHIHGIKNPLQLQAGFVIVIIISIANDHIRAL